MDGLEEPKQGEPAESTVQPAPDVSPVVEELNDLRSSLRVLKTVCSALLLTLSFGAVLWSTDAEKRGSATKSAKRDAAMAKDDAKFWHAMYESEKSDSEFWSRMFDDEIKSDTARIKSENEQMSEQIKQEERMVQTLREGGNR